MPHAAEQSLEKIKTAPGIARAPHDGEGLQLRVDRLGLLSATRCLVLALTVAGVLVAGKAQAACTGLPSGAVVADPAIWLNDGGAASNPRVGSITEASGGTYETGLLIYNVSANTLHLCNGMTWDTVATGSPTIAADSLDFDDFVDAMTLDAATTIAGTSNNNLILNHSGTVTPFIINNTGSGSSFVVNDQASDPTPFVIDAAGNVGIGTTTPAAAI